MDGVCRIALDVVFIAPEIKSTHSFGKHIETRSSNWMGKQHLTGLMLFQLDGNRLMN